MNNPTPKPAKTEAPLMELKDQQLLEILVQQAITKTKKDRFKQPRDLNKILGL
jgi:hypothetical protein